MGTAGCPKINLKFMKSWYTNSLNSEKNIKKTLNHIFLASFIIKYVQWGRRKLHKIINKIETRFDKINMQFSPSPLQKN